MGEHKIGEVSKLLDLSAEALRHYERIGIIKPRRNDNSGYRFFTGPDVGVLVITKWLRSVGFSLTDIEEMINKDDVFAQMEKFLVQESKLLAEIEDLINKLEKLRTIKRDLNLIYDPNFPADIVKTDEMWFLPFSKDEVFYVGDNQQGKGGEYIASVIKARYSFLLTPNRTNEKKGYHQYIGFSLPGYLEKPGPNAIRIPETTSMCFAIRKDATAKLREQAEQKIFSKLREKGYDLNRPMFGHEITQIKEDKGTTMYFKLYIPTERLHLKIPTTR